MASAYGFLWPCESCSYSCPEHSCPPCASSFVVCAWALWSVPGSLFSNRLCTVVWCYGPGWRVLLHSRLQVRFRYTTFLDGAKLSKPTDGGGGQIFPNVAFCITTIELLFYSQRQLVQAVWRHVERTYFDVSSVRPSLLEMHVLLRRNSQHRPASRTDQLHLLLAYIEWPTLNESTKWCTLLDSVYWSHQKNGFLKGFFVMFIRSRSPEQWVV